MITKLHYLIFILFISFCVCLLSVLVWLKQEQILIIYNETAVTSLSRETYGKFWKIIDSEKMRKHFEKELGVELPVNDFEMNYMLLSDGRRIKSIQYQMISKFTHWKGLIGIETYTGVHYPKTIFVYKVEKLILSQEGD